MGFGSFGSARLAGPAMLGDEPGDPVVGVSRDTVATGARVVGAIITGLATGFGGLLAGGFIAAVTSPESLRTKPSDSDEVYDRKEAAVRNRAIVGALIGSGIGFVGGSTVTYVASGKTTP